MEKRKYKMTRRAQEQERTRQKIVAATMALHGSVGPKATTISAVAEKAGVQRLTVYRHFPDEESLFLACSTQWLSENAPPNISDWADQRNPQKRTAHALLSLYGYFGETRDMWQLVYRDIDQVPAMQRPLDEFHDYLSSIRDDLLAGWQPKGRKSQPLRATVGHVLRFDTWNSLKSQNLSDTQMTDLAICWILSTIQRGQSDPIPG